MSDLVDRQAVINAIANTIVNGESLGYGLAEEIMSEIPSVDNNGEWIPVSERFPKAFETVLRTRVESGWNCTTYTMVDTGCICPIDYNIVAWMPLPEPYKAERGE